MIREPFRRSDGAPIKQNDRPTSPEPETDAVMPELPRLPSAEERYEAIREGYDRLALETEQKIRLLKREITYLDPSIEKALSTFQTNPKDARLLYVKVTERELPLYDILQRFDVDGYPAGEWLSRRSGDIRALDQKLVVLHRKVLENRNEYLSKCSRSYQAGRREELPDFS